MEPTCGPVRQTTMRLLAATLLIGICTLSACGTADHRSKTAGADRPTPSGTASACMDGGAGSASAKMDLDGDGTSEEVRAGASGKCPGVSAEVDGHPVSAPIGDLAPVTGMFGVALSGRPGTLAVTRQDHPRGGYQLHVFALEGKKLVELEDGGKPLVPFVATDTRPISATVDCRGDAIVVSAAVAGPSGTWDIRRTTYTMDGGTVRRTGSEVAGSKLSPKRVDQLMPVDRAVFPSCRA